MLIILHYYIQTIVNKRTWTGEEENNPETIEKRIRMDKLSDEPIDEPINKPNVSSAENPTESDSDQVSQLFGAMLLTIFVIHAMFECARWGSRDTYIQLLQSMYNNYKIDIKL